MAFAIRYSATRTACLRRLVDVEGPEGLAVGKAAAGEADGDWLSGAGCPAEVAVRRCRERRRSLGLRLVRGTGWVPGAGRRAGAECKVAEDISLSLSIKAPGWLVMLIVK